MIRDILLKDAFTIIILSLMIIITFIKLNYEQKFNYLIKIFWNRSYLKKYKKEKIIYNGFDYFLQINFVISISLFVYTFQLLSNNHSLSFDLIKLINIVMIIITFLMFNLFTKMSRTNSVAVSLENSTVNG